VEYTIFSLNPLCIAGGFMDVVWRMQHRTQIIPLLERAAEELSTRASRILSYFPPLCQ